MVTFLLSSVLAFSVLASVPDEAKEPGPVEAEPERDAARLVVFCQASNGEPYRAAQNARFDELLEAREDIGLVIFDGAAKPETQADQIKQAIKMQADLLIVAPVTSSAANEAMQAALDAGIPVICLERTASEPNYTTFIGVDNVAMGRLAGEAIVEALTEKNGKPSGRLIELTGFAGSTPSQERHQGAFEVLKPYVEDGRIEVVFTAAGNWMRQEAQERMAEAYKTVDGDFDVVFAHNDPMAYGAYLVVKELDANGKAEDAVFVGMDGLADEGRAWVKKGMMDASVRYPLCVDEAVEIGLKLLDDEDFVPEEAYTVDPGLITRATLKEEEQEQAE